MPNVTDKLSDQAMAASKLAATTNSDQHHRDASVAHQAAYMSAAANNRPSLAQHHLQEAAKHDKHADATTPEGKGTLALKASDKAKGGSADDHDAAAQAHQDAAHAYSQAGQGKSAMLHHDMAARHQQQASQLRQQAAQKAAPPGPVNSY